MSEEALVGESKGKSLQQNILEEQVIQALKGVYDPEIPVNIYDLGLIYEIDIDQSGVAKIKMTLTSPGCPVAQTFPGTVECAVKCVPGISDAMVELVWDPPWTSDQLTEAAKVQLGLI
ncbi:MAG: SUF system Fe-S cluster assembly protein [Gammaproteobacteria bacterium]|nr:SUF system Fe-S cluster assembly protein [Gammaproteobacteria bacterium]